MRIAIFDIGWKELHGPNPLSEPLGGSETWLTQISREFVRQGNAVDVFCFTKEAFIPQKNLTYWPKEEFYKFKTKYDFIILNRIFMENGKSLVNYIKENGLANHVYLQIHDLSLQIGGTLLTKGFPFREHGLEDNEFLTIVTLNEWHRSNLKWQYPTLTKDRICIPNGVDLSLFKSYRQKRNNRILWSSCLDRGLNILIDKIYPIVKAKIPDFGIDVARYNDDYKLGDIGDKDVKLIGKLSKEDLYKEQSKHKLWFYPGTFAETFCITMIENIMNGAQIVSPFTYGMGPVLANMTNGHPELVKMKNIFGRYGDTNISQAAVEEAANKIIGILSKRYEQPSIYKDMQEVIRRDYNWKHSVDLYLEHYKNLPKKEEKKPKKLLILSMNCNHPYFQALLGTVKNTWAKPIIQGKYPEVEWFAYTACDRKHPEPYIDYEDHMIYVKCGDGFYDTYEKTQLAYKMVKEAGIKFEWVLRTNTSVFLNLRKVLERFEQLTENDVITSLVGWYHAFPDGRREFKTDAICGVFFGMHRNVFDKVMVCDKVYDPLKLADDIQISYILFDKCPGIHIVTANNGPTSEEPKRYKPCEEKDLPRFAAEFPNPKKYFYDPKEINGLCYAQVRPIYGDLEERNQKGHEFEHFYELNDALD